MMATRADYASEYEHQCALFEHVALKIQSYPDLELLNANPNGGIRHRGAAGQLKASGTKKGFPDLELPVARGGWFGLYIELKRTHGGSVSSEQRWWLNRLTEQGNQAVVAHGWEHAWTVLAEYLDRPYTVASNSSSP